jgi:predicted NAD/FAD-binding protein
MKTPHLRSMLENDEPKWKRNRASSIRERDRIRKPIVARSSSCTFAKVRVAIIGSGGAGMAAAWLLDTTHEVTLYERASTLGGHAHTLDVVRDDVVHRIDDGFSWFSDQLYPAFMRLLEIHEIATRIIPMCLSVTQRPNNRTQILPPTRLGMLARTVADPPWLIDVLRFNQAINRAVPIVHGKDRTLSVGEFIERHGFAEPFASETLRPLLAGMWGAPYGRTDELAIYTLMKYLVFHRPSGLTRYPWHVIRDGAASYVAKVAAGLRAELRCAATVVHLERTTDARGDAQGDARGWTLIDGQGRRERFDHVIFAVGARDAARILADVPGLDATRQLLGRFEYYMARVATHGDCRFMPASRRDWCVANMSLGGRAPSELTLWSGSAQRAPIFTTYLADSEPEHVDHMNTFALPLPTASLHGNQARLSARQGDDELWFVGDWTHDFGSHEDAIQSAMQLCERLSPSSSRLAALRAPRSSELRQPLPGAAA